MPLQTLCLCLLRLLKLTDLLVCQSTLCRFVHLMFFCVNIKKLVNQSINQVLRQFIEYFGEALIPQESIHKSLNTLVKVRGQAH
jgi:hypothetical protein